MFLVIFGCYGVLNTVSERVFSDACHTIRNSNGCQILTITESFFLNGRNFIYLVFICNRFGYFNIS